MNTSMYKQALMLRRVGVTILGAGALLMAMGADTPAQIPPPGSPIFDSDDARQHTAKINFLEGSVSVIRAGESGAIPLTFDARLGMDDTIQTGFNASVEITCPGGLIARVGPGEELTISGICEGASTPLSFLDKLWLKAKLAIGGGGDENESSPRTAGVRATEANRVASGGPADPYWKVEEPGSIEQGMDLAAGGSYLEASQQFARVAEQQSNTEVGEQAEFLAALSYLTAGFDEEGVRRLQSFTERYPSSRWVGEARAYLDTAGAAGAP